MLPHLTLACSVLLAGALFVWPVADRDHHMAGTKPGATPGTTLPVNQLILRVDEAEGYLVLETVAGEPLQDESFIIRDGEATIEDFPTELVDSYREQGVQDIYSYYTNLTADGGESAVTISTRIYTLLDAAVAGELAGSFFDFVVEQALANPDAPQDIVRLESLPTHDATIDGWSATYQYVNINTGENPRDVPGFRFVAQVGAAVASAEVYGTDDSVSVELAEHFLVAQIDCLRADEPCEAIPFPGDISDDVPPKLGRLPGTDSRRRARRPLTS